MLSPTFSWMLVPLLVAMFLALNMGGSGTAPSFSAAFGARLLRKDLIPGLFGTFVFLGAIIAGKMSVRKLFVVWMAAPLISLALSYTLTAVAGSLGWLTP